MHAKPIYMTEAGFNKLLSRLEYIQRVEQPALAELLHDANASADPAENTEYLMLRDQFESLARRVDELEDMLRRAQLIQLGEPDGTVRLGNSVVVNDANSGPPETYRIVGSAETDPGRGFISNESPLGAALLGRAVGDEVTVATPDGELRFRILAVT